MSNPNAMEFFARVLSFLSGFWLMGGSEPTAARLLASSVVFELILAVATANVARLRGRPMGRWFAVGLLGGIAGFFVALIVIKPNQQRAVGAAEEPTPRCHSPEA